MADAISPTAVKPLPAASRTNSFREKEGDPGFLVAKGRFNASSEASLKSLLHEGVKTDDGRIIELKRQIDDERHEMEKKHVKGLASAIFMAVSNHGYATIRTIGRNSFYNAGKAVAIASGYCYSKGVRLMFGVSFDEGNLGKLRNKTHVENVTALLLTVEGFSSQSEGVTKVKFEEKE